MSRMFKAVTATWNPYKGCKFGCTYCWARDHALTRLKNTPKYETGFEPGFFPEELDKRFRAGGLVAVSLMGDMMGPWVPDAWIMAVFETIKKNSDTSFLLQTKDPLRYVDLIERHSIPNNCYLGVTIESNRHYPQITQAPSPSHRFIDITHSSLRGYPKFLSIEPIMSFDLETFLSWIEDIRPSIIEVGADNYNHKLPEPSAMEVNALLKSLGQYQFEVNQKSGLSRILEGAA